MHRRFVVILVVLASLLLSSCGHPSATHRDGPLILISIDGFRWDYLELHAQAAPTLAKLAADGVHATRMTPSFPSKTFPNHYTLVTGLRPEHHGIVSNWFRDPALNDVFDMSRTETVWWAGGEPIWITAEKNGVRTGCYFWPGSESELQGLRPSNYATWNKQASPEARVDGALEWLALPVEKRPRLVTLYFDIVDSAGHDFGPRAPKTAEAVRTVDAAISRLLAGLERLGLRESANLVIVSDHGMSETSPDRVIFLDDLMPINDVLVEATGPYAGVRPKPGVDIDALVAGIRAKAPPQVRVFRREEMPPSLHYDTGDRIPPILLLPDDHWCVERKQGWPALRARYHSGNHGWDPALPNMGALFIAQGPAFRRRVEIPNVDNVDVYNLLCATLSLPPAPNDGGDALVRAALAR
jgi:predicted AlkP superfamily pyrophosphatase or phosphodiesterase